MQLLGLDTLSLAIALVTTFAVLLALYLRKQPAQRVIVPSLAAWLELPASEAPGVRRQLRTPLSFLLALLIASLLLAALSDPRNSARDLVLAIDHGISMSASDVKPSRLEAAKRAAHARIDTLGPRRAQVITFASRANILSPLTDDHATLHAAIDRVGASDDASDASALNLTEALPPHDLVVFSDRIRYAKAEAEHVRVGNSARNVALTNLSARRDPLDTQTSCTLSVINFGEQAESGVVHVGVSTRTFALAAHERAELVFNDQRGNLEAWLELRAGPDALTRDDRATATLPAPRARVLLQSPDRYLEAALAVDPSLAVTHDPEAAHDVAIFDHIESSETPAIYFGSGNGEYVERPFFDRIESTPLLRGFSLRDVNITRARRTQGAHVLAASAQGLPLLIEGPRYFAFTFALSESDLALRAAFPVLLLRMIDQLTGSARVLPEPAGVHAGPIAPAPSQAQQHEQARLWWPWLAAIALLALVFEWFSHRRRWTV